MERYFIDVFNGHTKHQDTIGSELASAIDAKNEAVAALIDLMHRQVQHHDTSILRTSIRNKDDAVIYEGGLSFTGLLYD